jgi:ProP effector
MLATLSQRWPNSFDLNNRRPLKIGIDHDLTRELGDPALRPELKAALNLYCGNLGYLSGLKAGTSRLDLDGNEVDFVSREDELRAAARLKGLKTAKPAVNNAVSFCNLYRGAKLRPCGSLNQAALPSDSLI